MAALKLDADLYRFASRHAIFQVFNLAHIVVDVYAHVPAALHRAH